MLQYHIQTASPRLVPRASAGWKRPAIGALLLLAAISSGPAAPAGGPAWQIGPALDPRTWNYAASLLAALESLGTGVSHLRTGGFASALAAFPNASAARSTAVEDYIQLYRGEARLGLDDAGAALAEFRDLRWRFPDSPVREEAALGEAEALLKLADPEAVLAALGEIRPREGPEQLWLRTRALEASGRRSEAVAACLQLYAEWVDTGAAEQAEARLRSLMPDYRSRSASRDIILQRGQNLLRAGRNQDARALLQEAAARIRSGQPAQRLELLLGEACANLKRYPEALRHLRRVSDAELADRAAYLEGICQRNLGNETALLAVRDRALKMHPGSAFTEKLLYSLATYYDAAARRAAAQEAYQAIVDRFPSGEHFEIARWKVALYAYVDGRDRDALRIFGECLLNASSAAAAGAPAYWIGRCCRRLGLLQRAAYFFSRALESAHRSYYGQQAEAALAELPPAPPPDPESASGIDFGPLQRKIESLPSGAPALQPPSGAALRILERARQLAAAGLPDLALVELNSGRNALPADAAILAYALARIHESRNDYVGAIIALRRVYPDYLAMLPERLPEEIWNLLFPTRFADLVARNAAVNGLDPDLILALIRQESAFQESARSGADARGLLQVLPATGRSLARAAGIQGFTIGRLYHPETNLMLGTRYFSTLLRRYDGRVEFALAAYNAGTSRVDRWRSEFAGADTAEFIERIPFSETRDYVKLVLSIRAHYRSRASSDSR